jgi:hypothetical protein
MLPLRMERHVANALAVARHLQRHPSVAWVRYQGLPEFARGGRYLPGTGAGQFGTLSDGRRWCNACGCLLLASLAATRASPRTSPGGGSERSPEALLRTRFLSLSESLSLDS